MSSNAERTAIAAKSIQKNIRGANARKTEEASKVKVAQADAKKKATNDKQAADEKTKKEALKKQTDEAAKRQAMAEQMFSEVDVSGDDEIDQDELGELLTKLLSKEGWHHSDGVVKVFVREEFVIADLDNDGKVSFDEFVEYYNSLVDRLAKGELKKKLERQQTIHDEIVNKKEDQALFLALHSLLTVLRNESVRWYSGLVIPFEHLVGEGAQIPVPELGTTTAGLILDLSRGVQRIVTPWGSLPLGYLLCFPNFQDKKQEQLQANEEDSPSDPPSLESSMRSDSAHVNLDGHHQNLRSSLKGLGILEQIPSLKPTAAAPSVEERSLFLELAKRSNPLLSVRKLPRRCHFLVTELLGEKLPRGEVVDVPSKMQVGVALKRFQELSAANKKLPKPDQLLPDETPPLGKPLINRLLGRVVKVHPELVDALRRKVSTSRNRSDDEDLVRALTLADEASTEEKRAGIVEEAKRLLQQYHREEDALFKRRQGYAIRSSVQEDLNLCSYNVEEAQWLQENAKEVERNVTSIMAQTGLASGLGYPTKGEIRLLLAKEGNDLGKAMVALKKRWRAEVEMMADLIATAEVEELLTPEMCRAAAFQTPASREEREHVEALYHETFEGDQARTRHFLSAAGEVMKRARHNDLGDPSRLQVEELLRKLHGDPEQVYNYLLSCQRLLTEVAPKNGKPSREDVVRYMEALGRDELKAEALIRSIWKLVNPKPPRQDKKAKTVKPHPAAECGFPNRHEAESALLCVDPQLDVGKAQELLVRLKLLSADREDFPEVDRSDVLWSLDPEREKRYLVAWPIKHEEYLAGKTPASKLLESISALLSKKGDWGDPPRKDVWSSLERFTYDDVRAEKWLKGSSVLMHRRKELGIVGIEEIEECMCQYNNDADKVIELFELTAQLMAEQQATEGPTATREDTKLVLGEVWDEEDRRALALVCCTSLARLLADEGALLNIGVVGKAKAGDKDFLTKVLHRFRGDCDKASGLLKKLTQIMQGGEELGHPDRTRAMQVLDEFHEDTRLAIRHLKEKYRNRREKELYAQYHQNREVFMHKLEEEMPAEAATLKHPDEEGAEEEAKE